MKDAQGQEDCLAELLLWWSCWYGCVKVAIRRFHSIAVAPRGFPVYESWGVEFARRLMQLFLGAGRRGFDRVIVYCAIFRSIF